MMYANNKYKLRIFGLVFLMLPVLSIASDLLLSEDDLIAKIGKESNYQLLDARNAEAQRSTPLAFSTRYEKDMLIKKGLVFVVADNDAVALEVAQSIPANGDRSVFAVKGGADVWRQVQSRTAPVVAPAFIVPKGTCEPGVPSLRIDAKSSKKAGKETLESINK